MTSKQALTIDFDHHCPFSTRDPDDGYRELLHRHPIAWSAAHGGYWIVNRHADVMNILRDYRNFSSRDGMAIPDHKGGDYGTPVKLDPPEHLKYRKVMNPLMTKDAVQDVLRPQLERWTAHYIDRVIEQGQCDMAYDIAVPIPGAVTLEWVGWTDRDEWDRISQAWHDLLAYPLDHPRTHQSHRDLTWFTGRIVEELDRRRHEPCDDIMSMVANMEVDGKPIEAQRAISMITVWVAGGVDTATTYVLAGLDHFHRFPEHRTMLREQPELWDSALEEIIRRYPPTRTTTRTAINEVEVGGVKMMPGDRILLSMTSANLDPAVFECPEEVRLDRKPNQHLSYGGGAHKCVGQHLARDEFRIIAGEVLRRMPDYVLDDARVAPYERQSEMRGWTSMPATFTPGRRSDAVAVAA